MRGDAFITDRAIICVVRSPMAAAAKKVSARACAAARGQ